VIGDDLPVPMNGLLASVRVLALEDLDRVVADASWFAQHLSRGAAWRGAEMALLAYGIAACAELEFRGKESPYRLDDQVAWLVNMAKYLEPRAVSIGANKKPDGTIMSVRIRYAEPSWMRMTELHVRHRAALLRGPQAAFYAMAGWREQLGIDGEADTRLPPHDPTAGVVRWILDTSKDW
jgi:hypothetical protein